MVTRRPRSDRKRRRIQNEPEPEADGNGERTWPGNESRSHTYSCWGGTRAHANCRRLSVPFQANPIIRNETASFYGLVQAYLFIRGTARTRGFWGGNVRRATQVPSSSYPYPLAYGGGGTHVDFPSFRSLPLFGLFRHGSLLGDTVRVRVCTGDPFVSWIQRHTDGTVKCRF